METGNEAGSGLIPMLKVPLGSGGGQSVRGRVVRGELGWYLGDLARQAVGGR